MSVSASRPDDGAPSEFDHYRRCQRLLARLNARPDLAELHSLNAAKKPAPDSIRPRQKVVPHLAWAAVVATVARKQPPGAVRPAAAPAARDQRNNRWARK